MKVGLNFENPVDPSLSSSISLGFFEEKYVYGGFDNLFWFANTGKDEWAIEVD